jgi:hypothetical protein
MERISTVCGRRADRALRLALVTGLIVAVVAVIALAPAQAGEWKGKVTTVDGVKTVENPATPFEKPTAVRLEELWTLGGDTDDEDEFFGVIADIDIDDQGFVYLLDSQLAEVKVYTNDGEFVRSIGREGEGPGEFRRPNAIFFTDDGNVAVLQTIPGKIVILTKEGDPVGDHPLPEPEDGGFQILGGGNAAGGNLVLFMGRTKFDQGNNKWSRADFLTSIDGKGNQLAEYATKTNTIDMANASLDDAKWDTFERRWTVGPDGKVYAACSYDDYTITVWNKDGKIDKVIKRDYKHLARTGEERDFQNKLMTHFAQRIPNCKVIIHDNNKDIENLYVREDGGVWVLSSSGARDLKNGALGVFDVYNKDGQFVRNVTLQGRGDPLDDLYVFVKDRFYVVTSFLQAAMSAQGVQDLYDEEEEVAPMSIICYKLEGDMLSAR